MTKKNPSQAYVTIDLDDPKNQIYKDIRDGLQATFPRTLSCPKTLTDRLIEFGVSTRINENIEPLIASLGMAYTMALLSARQADPKSSDEVLKSRLSWEVIFHTAYSTYFTSDAPLREAVSNATEGIDLEEIAPGLSKDLDINELTQLYALEVAKLWFGIGTR